MSYPSDFFETLVAAGSIASANTVYPTKMIESVFLGVEPNYQTVGNTVNVLIPTVNTSDVSNITNGDISDTAVADTSVALTLNTKQSTSFVIRNFDQLRASPNNLAEYYVKPKLEALLRVVNSDLTSLVTTSNFSTNGTVTGGSDIFTRANLSTMWAKLVSAGAPVNDTSNMFFITHSDVYANMAADSSLSQESIVGINAAESIQQRAVFLRQLGAELRYDPQMPLPTAGVYAGLMFHRGAICLRTAIEPPLGDSAGYVKETILYPKGNTSLPVKLQMWNDPVKQGIRVHLSCVYGKAVVRSEFGCIGLTT